MKKMLLMAALILWSGLQVVMAQSRPIRGQVLDEKGDGLPGASVQVKNGKGGTTTDIDGNFSLDVPDGSDALIINAIGYSPNEVKAGDGDKAINVKLVVAGKVLGETVVTALNIKREKKALGYSVSEVNTEQIEQSGERNAIEALAAKAPGVQITSSGGTPGASTKIRLRGNSTFSGNNDPLIVVDGIPIDNSTQQPVAGDAAFNPDLSGVNQSNRALDLNPDDIASISVLKGPAAASIYGANGANGAIIITTKKGSYGKGLGITVNSSVEINKVSKLPKTQNLFSQGNNGTWDNSGSTPNSWGANVVDENIPTFDNFANFFKTGLGFNNSISITGGSEIATMRVGFGNYTTTGMIPNSKLNRTNATLSGEVKLTNWLTAGASAQYSYTAGRRVQNGSNLAGTMLSLFRMPVSYDVTDNYYDPVTHTSNNYFNTYDNPLYSVYRNPYTDETNRILGNIYLNATISKDWAFTYKLGTDAYTTYGKQIYDLGSKGNDLNNGLGQLNLSTISYMQVYSDAILKYNKRISDFSINAFIGLNYWYKQNRINFLRGNQQEVPDFYNLSGYTNLYASNQDEYQRSQAFYGEANFGYKSFLYVTVGGRLEHNTAFGNNAPSFFYPKIDGAWVFSEHLNKNNILSFGKLRAAVAKAGISPYKLYTDRNYYAQPTLTDGYTNGNGFPYLNNLGYAPNFEDHLGNIKPETVTGKELGLELKFWQNRIGFEATYYNQKSENLILSRPVAPASGYSATFINSGSMRNQGLELALNAEVYKNKDWDVNLGINWSMNRNKVLSLGGAPQFQVDQGFEETQAYAVVGKPYGTFYGSVWERDAQGRLQIGEDGLPLVASNNQSFGNPNPDWLMGMNGDISYKGFTFSMLWDIRHGGDVWNGTWARLSRIGRTDESVDRNRTYLIEGVYAAGTAKEGQANTTEVSGKDYFQNYKGDFGAAENSIQDGGWVRLRSIGLSYRLKFNKSSNPFKYVELGFTGRNLFLSTKYKGVDPETGLTGGGSNISGFDYFNNPGSKSYIFNLRFGL